jgi:hypothetical protein
MIKDPLAYIESIKSNARISKQKGINGYVISEYAAIGSEIKQFIDAEHAKKLAKSFGEIKTTSIPVETLFHVPEQGRYDLIFFSKAAELEMSTHVKIKDHYFAGNVVVVCFDKVKGVYLDVPPVINTLNVLMEYLPPDRVPTDKKMTESALKGYKPAVVSKANEINEAFDKGKEFEIFTAEYFRALGYEVEERWHLGVADAGIDLIATKYNECALIQCKFYKERGEFKIDKELIRKFYGDCQMYLDSNPIHGMKIRRIMVGSGDVLDYGAKHYLREYPGKVEFMPVYYTGH